MSDQKDSILKKLQRYCSLQDRSVQKIREKLYVEKEITESEKAEIICELLEENYLDDKRFTENYIRSKVNQNKWGRNKITQGLYRHKVDEKIIEEGLHGINTERYNSNLIKLYQQKSKTGVDREKLIRFFIQRGYEYDEIMSVIS